MQKSNILAREEALPLLLYNEKTKSYLIEEETAKYISSIPEPIGVIGVAGMYRTGKSYLLNRMILDRSAGFGVGPTINPCTKGLWVWGTPLKGYTENGQSINILVIDSEGLGALDEDSNHDAKIFSLIILLSSSFLYNSIGNIDENAIQNLSLVANITKNIQLKMDNNDDIECEDYAEFFPSFSWIIRDFSLKLVDEDGDFISSKQYLEKALHPQNGFSDDVEEKNRIRRLLTSFFPERDCFTLVRPLVDEENLQNLERMELKNLRPEFYEQVSLIIKRLNFLY